jgi:hypothetical protein
MEGIGTMSVYLDLNPAPLVECPERLYRSFKKKIS